ncbi:COP1-interacting protein 7 isoform X3 [Helianthus annuus]|uniref:COP1-interacting protein 7 isoform X3 n=1 Tax=Helianthus annuus TaxID=4232 RepID=UPI0016532F24|nr:COP1-interacting protein 7 isoform X3 [Helianthus annuus]
MKSTSLLDSAVFQLTPTRTSRCDLYIIANGKKEKIASGLLNPFIAHLKTAQDQIAQGGYSVLLAPQAGSNATWFTKSTLQSFVRFVSTPEILERVYTIESEILQIEEAIAIQGNTDISIKDQYIKPASSNEGNKPAAGDVNEEEKAIVLYTPGAPELPSPSTKERNSKAQLINVLETRKTVLKKEQGMAFARAVAAGFEIENVANLLSFAECFGASRLMSGCLRFMNLWKQKHESGQWVEIEAEDAMSDCTASAIVHSETAGTNTNAAGGEQQYHGGQHPGFAPWGMHSSPQGDVRVPVYQAYPMPYYQHYPGFYPPPPHYPSPSPVEEESPEHRKSAGKKKSGRVVIRNINFVNSKTKTSSESASSDTDTGDHDRTQQQKRNLRSPKRKGNCKEETDGSHWDAFQTCLLKSAEEGDREDMYAMEKDPKTKRRQKTENDPLSAHARQNDDGEGRHMQMYDANGRKIVNRGANDDDFITVGRREEMNVRDSSNGFEENANLDKSNGLQHDEAVMVSLRSTSGVNDYNITKGLKLFDLPENKSNKPPDVKYEPDALSLMPERDVGNENIGYDPAIDYEMQLAASASHDKTSKQDKKGSKSSAEKHQLSKPNQGMVRKVRPSKVNNNNNNKSTLEEARARADKLRSYKAELQKMKKEQQDAEQKRLELLKMERQKRIYARTTNSSKKQLPSLSSSTSKLSPISHMRGSTKFTDSEPGSSSPLQRSKIRPSINNAKKPSTNSAAGNRMTRSLSSMSDTKKELTSVSKASSSMTRIRRLSEPRKINNTTSTPHTKTKSAESVSKPRPKPSNGSTETKKISEPIEPSKAKVKVKPSVEETTSEVAKLNLNNRLSDAANDNSSPVVVVIDKTVVMLEEHNNKQPSSITNSDHRTGVNIHEVPKETVDKGTISVHPTTSSEVCVEEVGKKYEAPYARVSSFEDQSTRNSEYAKAVPHHQAFGGNGTAAYVSNLKMEKIPEKPQSKGGFRRLIKLGKKTPSVQPPPPPPPQVDTLKSLISADEHAQKSSRRLFSFQFRGEKKATSSGS